LSGAHAMRFTPQGLRVFPHRIEPSGATGLGAELLSSGNAELDVLLGGGLESGTATIITGPSGVGKTTLGLEFLRASIAGGRRAIVFTFEESPESIRIRSRGIGLPLEAQLSSGALQLLHLNPMAIYPDEFLAMLQTAVEQEGRQVVMIDSLRGYQLEMNESRNPLAHIHNLVNYLGSRGVSSFLINEVEAITGNLTATEIGVSHLSDNILLARYAEYQGHIIKVIACLKKRLGDFQPELRELRITPAGIVVGAKLENMHRVLTGVPEY
jgi:circadian clock protein KaiC